MKKSKAKQIVDGLDINQIKENAVKYYTLGTITKEHTNSKNAFWANMIGAVSCFIFTVGILPAMFAFSVPAMGFIMAGISILGGGLFFKNAINEFKTTKQTFEIINSALMLEKEQTMALIKTNTLQNMLNQSDIQKRMFDYFCAENECLSALNQEAKIKAECSALEAEEDCSTETRKLIVELLEKYLTKEQAKAEKEKEMKLTCDKIDGCKQKMKECVTFEQDCLTQE